MFIYFVLQKRILAQGRPPNKCVLNKQTCAAYTEALCRESRKPFFIIREEDLDVAEKNIQERIREKVGIQLRTLWGRITGKEGLLKALQKRG